MFSVELFVKLSLNNALVVGSQESLIFKFVVRLFLAQ